MKRREVALFLFFFITVLAIYFPTCEAGFVTDFYGWQDKFNRESILGAWNTFGWHANQQVSVFFFYLLYRLFGTNGWGWHICFSMLHAVNGYLLFRLFERILKIFSINNASILSFFGSMLFLLSPFNAEVVVWRVCLLYLMAGFLILMILWQLLNYLETGKKKFLWIIYALFFPALFTFEISLIMPLLMLAMVLLWNACIRKETGLFKDAATVVLPSFFFIGIYFLANKILLNEWVSHYGAAVHLNFSFNDATSKYFRYFFKYTLFFRYWKYNTQMSVFSFLQNQTGLDLMLSLSVVAFGAYLIFFKSLSNRLRLTGFCLVMFFVSLTPVITLYMVTLLYGENDRYGYLASMFFWMMIVILFSALPKKMFYGSVTLLIGISAFLLIETNYWWATNTEIYYSLLNDFRWYDKDEVVVLNIPDNYRGLYMFRIYNNPSGLKEGLDLIRKKPFEGKMTEVTQYNMMKPTDGVNVKIDSVNNITVTLHQWGNWWWREGIGAADYQNDSYSVHFDGISYHLHFKNLATNHAIIYQDGEKWKEVVM